MAIIFHTQAREFHLYNNEISYIIKILDNNQLGNLYYGKRITDQTSFSHLLEKEYKPLGTYVFEDNADFSLQYIKQEYPAYGTTDFRYPAYEIEQENGSKITDFQYTSHHIFKGKKLIEGLPATYTESDDEAETLEVVLFDQLINADIVLSYTIFKDAPVITRSVKFINNGMEQTYINIAMSLNVDLPDCNYSMLHLTGAWSRERHISRRKLEKGTQSISSMRGASSSEHNPFIALSHLNADEVSGDVYGFSLIYSGNFLAQVEVDSHDTTRIIMGIHPHMFRWTLEAGCSFSTPEAVMVYSNEGFGKMSRAFHKLFRTRLVRGVWRDQVRPILINNWEATGCNFDEDKILKIVEPARKLGIELFVLDDGWFGNRNDDRAGLGDWYVNREKLPNGINGLADKIEALGMKFGLWFEPEMVNMDSDLYRDHPDWILATPGRKQSHGRNQYVLDFSRPEVVQYIYESMARVLGESIISYVKWDMNRYITECYSVSAISSKQGEIMHRYILGVYNLYERLTSEFPEILFESCASGGARFDPGMLYYAPQGWTSDDTDAIERVKIQYGTSLVYPVCCMGAHVSEVPNQQLLRITPIETRANVAYFGAFGYELDLNELDEDEIEKVRKQVIFAKRHRELIQKGNFYRLRSPFEGNGAAWMIVSENRGETLVGYYQFMNEANQGYKRVKLEGLEPSTLYSISGKDNYCYGDELMNVGLIIKQEELCAGGADYSSVVYYIVRV